MNTAILGVLETSLYALDLDAAERFYVDVLGLALHSRAAGRHVFLRCGTGMLLLFQPERTRVAGGEVPPHGGTGEGHVALAVPETDIDAWRTRLQDAGVRIEAEVTWPRGGRSLYFRDPAGNSLELTSPRIWGLPEVTVTP